YLDTDGNAHSPTHILRSSAPTTEFDTDPLTITFTSAQSTVKLWAGCNPTGLTITGTLKAYDATGALLLSDGPRTVPLGAYTAFQVTATSATITRVTLEYAGAYGAAKLIDDLEIVGVPPPPPPAAPIVRITAPTNSQQLTASA